VSAGGKGENLPRGGPMNPWELGEKKKGGGGPNCAKGLNFMCRREKKENKEILPEEKTGTRISKEGKGARQGGTLSVKGDNKKKKHVILARCVRKKVSKELPSQSPTPRQTNF